MLKLMNDPAPHRPCAMPSSRSQDCVCVSLCNALPKTALPKTSTRVDAHAVRMRCGSRVWKASRPVGVKESIPNEDARRLDWEGCRVQTTQPPYSALLHIRFCMSCIVLVVFLNSHMSSILNSHLNSQWRVRRGGLALPRSFMLLDPMEHCLQEGSCPLLRYR